MQGVAFLLIGLLGAGGLTEYSRALDAKGLDQATLDAEGYGEKKAFKRDDDGLRITLGPGEPETGWKTPPQLRIGGDFTISANLVVRTLPKPAQEDGAAVGLAIAFQDVNQPDVTLVRLREPNGSEVYRSIERAGQNPSQPQFPMPFQQPGGKPAKPPRRTFPAAGDSVRLELQREGSVIRFQVLDGVTGRPRYLGQVSPPGTNDVAALKLFVSNRNGAEAVNVLLRDLTVRAARITGLGTSVRTVYDAVVYGEPTSIEDGALVVGGPPKSPAPAAPKPPEGKPAGGPAPGSGKTAETKADESPKAAQEKAAASGVPIAKDVFRSKVGGDAKTSADRAPDAPKSGGDGPARAKPAENAPKPTAASPASPPKPKEKARIPLDEVEAVRFERTPTLTGRFIGQPNLDVTMPGLSAKKDDAASKDGVKKAAGADDPLAPPPGTTAAVKVPKVEPKKNGVRDLYLTLSNLRNVAIKQVMVNCQTDRGPTAWRLDTTDSQDWPLVVRRSGAEASADLFLEPPQGDCHQKDFTIAVTYADGQAANTTVKAGEHTDPKLAVDPDAPSGVPSDAWVYLTGEEKLFGKLVGVGEETLRLTTPWQDRLDVPLSRVVGVHVGLLERKETPESFARRLKARGSEDLLLAQTKGGEVLAISGVVEKTENDKLHFVYQGKSRTLPLKQVEGLVMAARPDPAPSDNLHPLFSLAGGAAISGRWKDLDTSAWKVETAWGQELKIPAAEVLGVRFQGGKMTYLSDLSPSKVEETPFFGRRLPWRRDVGLTGEPLKMNGQTFDRGLAVHSRCVLTYDLNGRYATFEALVGFDDAVKGKGRVDCRVFADGKELYSNPDLRADGPPLKLSLPVAGAGQLRLQVDYGRGQDTGDRLIWANARLYRRPPPSVSSATPTPRRDLPAESDSATERR